MIRTVIMPKLGTTMKEGTIGQWNKKVGDYVEKGSIILTVESDKASVDIEAERPGILVKILKESGEVVPVASMIGIMADSLDENISEYLDTPVNTKKTDTKEPVAEQPAEAINPAAVAKTAGKAIASPKAKALARQSGLNLQDIAGTGKDGLITESDVQSALVRSEWNKQKATPVAQKIAELHEINLSELAGSGPHGKIMKSDVAAVVENNVQQSSKQKLMPFTGMRKAISDNMMKSVHGMAHAYHKMKIDMTEAVRLRSSLKDTGIKVSYNDLFIKAIAKALTEFPIMNSSLTENGILIKEDINIGVAVALENGLIVPNIKNANRKSLSEISFEALNLAEKARAGKLLPQDYQGGTFTVTNLGMYDVDEFLAIINPPEIGIISIGKIEETPVVQNGSIVIKPAVAVCLTYDHRIVDGVPAAQFLKRVKQIIQLPYLLL